MSSASVTNEIPAGLQTLFAHFGREVVRVTQDLCLSDENMTSIPVVMRDFHCLLRLDISRNLLRHLPVTLMAEYFPVLQELDVSHNRLSDMANVQQVGMMPHLQKLNLLHNPLVSVNQRDALLNHLIFSGRRPGEEELRGVLGVEPDLLLEDTLGFRGNVISSESISKMLISGISPGNIPPHTAVKLLSSTNSVNARPVVYCDLNAAPVPRNTPFPRLTHLNGLAISKEDIDLAGSHPSQHLHVSLGHRSLIKSAGAGREWAKKQPVQAKDEEKKGKKKGKKEGKVRGRKLVAKLEQDLQQLLWAHKEKRVQKTLARLLRDGHLESGKWLKAPNLEPEATNLASGSEVESAGEELESDGEEAVGGWEEAEAEEVLGAVLRRGGERPSAAFRIALMARKAQAGGRGAEAGGGEVSGREPTVGRQHRQRTHPPAWWDADGGEEEASEQEALPTRLTVLEQGRDELEGTRQSLRRMKAIGVLGGEKWTRLQYKTALTELTKVAAGERDGDVEGGGPGGEGAAASADGQQLSFGDVLKAELEDQRDKDTTFLELELPKQCRKLKIEAWMREKKEVEGVTEEIERLFTATNIHNKMASSQGVRGGGSQGLSLATHEKRARDQKNQELFSSRLSKHQERLKVIYKGGWPGQGKRRTEDGGSGAASALVDVDREGKEDQAWLSGLTKTLDRMEKHAWGGNDGEQPAGEEGGAGDAGGGDTLARRLKGKARGFRKEEMRPLSIDAILEDKALPGGGESEPLLLVRRENLKDVRRELDELHHNFVDKELQFDKARHDVGAALDKLIVERGFGEFGLKKIQINGMDFDETGQMDNKSPSQQQDLDDDVDDVDDAPPTRLRGSRS